MYTLDKDRDRDRGRDRAIDRQKNRLKGENKKTPSGQKTASEKAKKKKKNIPSLEFCMKVPNGSLEKVVQVVGADFQPERFGATFYAQKRCLSQFFDIQTGFNSTRSHKMPDRVPM